MDNRRKHDRIKFEAGCLLMVRDGNTYQALLEDISLGGALLMISDKIDFQIGDLCDLILSDKSAAFPIKRSGKIVRIDPEIIGVTFLS